MLHLHMRDGWTVEAPADLSTASLPPEVVWIDLSHPQPPEIAFVERVTGLLVPSLADLSEIESSSRLRVERDALYLSTPLVHRAETNEPGTTSLGFVLTRERLITVRFETLRPFDSFVTSVRGKAAAEAGGGYGSSSEVFVGLVEAIVDRLADVLERIAAELDTLSHRLFRSGAVDGVRHRRPAREDADLRVILRRIGHGGDLSSKIRDSLLGLARIVPFVGNAVPWLPADIKGRLEALRLDVVSLSDYDAHLLNKVQLLLDATLGLINVEQNNIIKVLTVVSVVGVPPTLVASMYGMNFKYMPELGWTWGYPYGLALILLSAVVPLLWFKWRGWL